MPSPNPRPRRLFDVLDADGSGAIDISELISGLMKLRSGGACVHRRGRQIHSHFG